MNDKSDRCSTGPSFCTWADPELASFGAPLPGGGTGLALSLSQAPCDTPGGCCGDGECAQWAGGHLTTQKCLHYGTVTFTASLQGLPVATQGAFYLGLRVTAPNDDPQLAQNEIDVGLSQATVLPASESKHEPHVNDEVMPVTGEGAELVTAYFGPGAQLAAFNPGTQPAFTSELANNWTTYSFVWAPGTIHWYVNGQLYWSASTAVQPTGSEIRGQPNLVPWRPMDLRIIARTNSGSPEPAPPGVVYIRSMSITPYTGTVPQDVVAAPPPLDRPPPPLARVAATPSPGRANSSSLSLLPPPMQRPPPPSPVVTSTTSTSTDWSLLSSTSSSSSSTDAGMSRTETVAGSNPGDPWLMGSARRI